MATGLVKRNTIIGIEKETTEGTYRAPQATTSYIQPLADGFGWVPGRELIDRNILSTSIGRVTPRLGQKSVEVALPVELRASGVEGGDVDFAALLEGAFGAKRSITTTTTTKSSGNTGSILGIEDADISKFNLFDIIVIKESGGHHACVITAKSTGTGTATITVSPAKGSGSFSNSVVISKTQMYLTASSGHPSISVSEYIGNQVNQKGIGCKVTGMSLEGFETGGVASLNFGLSGLDYDEVDGAAPHTPAYDTGIPPIILNACVFKDGAEIQINALGLNLQNTLGFTQNTCEGKTGSRVTKREVSGSMNPYKDDTDVGNFTNFNAGTEFALFVSAYIPSAVAGEITMGSVVGIYLPKCVITGYKPGDVDDIVTDDLEFQVVRGSAGTTEEMYMGFI